MATLPPPLPRVSERREHERVRLVAEVQCSAADEVYVLDVRDASLGGLFLEADPAACPKLVEGTEVILALAPENEPDSEPIRAYGQVTRVEKPSNGSRGGFGLTLIVDQRHYQRMARLMVR